MNDAPGKVARKVMFNIAVVRIKFTKKIIFICGFIEFNVLSYINFLHRNHKIKTIKTMQMTLKLLLLVRNQKCDERFGPSWCHGSKYGKTISIILTVYSIYRSQFQYINSNTENIFYLIYRLVNWLRLNHQRAKVQQ